MPCVTVTVTVTVTQNRTFFEIKNVKKREREVTQTQRHKDTRIICLQL